MTEFVHYPRCLLPPRLPTYMLNPSSRGTGSTLDGTSRATRTSRGFWRASFEDIALVTHQHYRSLDAIDVALGGRAGLLVLPVYVHLTAPYPLVAGRRVYAGAETVPHSDGTPFSDDTEYQQGSIAVRMAEAAALGDTTVTLRLLHGEPSLPGTKFSFQHALYKIGPYTSQSGELWTVPISPRIRAPIPADAGLEFTNPTCLVHLARDDGWVVPNPLIGKISRLSVDFIEATDYWADRAAGLV